MGYVSEILNSRIETVRQRISARVPKAVSFSTVFKEATKKADAGYLQVSPQKEEAIDNTTMQPKPKVKAVSGSSKYDVIIAAAAQETGLDAALIKAVIRAESSFNASAVSYAGAQGLMQLMPGTARELGVSNAFDAEQNIKGGATYLKKQLDRFDDIRLALAAYNTGPGRISKLNITDASDTEQYGRIASGVRGYVSKVMEYYDAYSTAGKEAWA
ncbi:MAG: lytic transglycosylase domain-containing protein [Christensenellales bacterium]|jgi:soluble lytic murein transglycosylase-like protein